MKTIKNIIIALLLSAGSAVQAQQVMTVKTDDTNDKFQLTSRLVIDLTGKKPVVRTNEQVQVYTPGTGMLVYLMPTADGTYQIVDGQASFYNPEDRYYKTITYTRNFQNTDWQLLYLPLRLSFSEWNDMFDVASLNDVHQYDSDMDGRMDVTELEVVLLRDGYTEPNTPYLIRARKTGQYTITQQGATLFASEISETTVCNVNTNFTIRGTYDVISGGELGANTFFAMDSNSLAMNSGQGQLDAFRWYVTVTDRKGSPMPMDRIRIREASDIDAISAPAAEQDKTDIYDLSGRKVNRIGKGIYIKNGQKVVLK